MGVVAVFSALCWKHFKHRESGLLTRHAPRIGSPHPTPLWYWKNLSLSRLSLRERKYLTVAAEKAGCLLKEKYYALRTTKSTGRWEFYQDGRTEKLGMLCVSPLRARARAPLRACACSPGQSDGRPCGMVVKSACAHRSHDRSGFPLDKQKAKTESSARTSLAASDAQLKEQTGHGR